MENITTEKVMDKLHMFQAIFGKVDEFDWWDMERIQTDSGTYFTSKEFQEGIYVRGVQRALLAPYHQEMNGQVEVTWRKLLTIAHSILAHVRVSEEYIHFALMYTADHILSVLPIKYLVNQDVEPTTPHKMATGMKH